MEPPLWQRLVGPLFYLLPWSDAIPLGFAEGGLFLQYPLLRPLVLPAFPLMQLERSIPLGLGGLLLFFVLFLAVVRNPNVPYFVRFNALQALLTDIALIVISGMLIGDLNLLTLLGSDPEHAPAVPQALTEASFAPLLGALSAKWATGSAASGAGAEDDAALRLRRCCDCSHLCYTPLFYDTTFMTPVYEALAAEWGADGSRGPPPIGPLAAQARGEDEPVECEPTDACGEQPQRREP